MVSTIFLAEGLIPHFIMCLKNKLNFKYQRVWNDNFITEN